MMTDAFDWTLEHGSTPTLLTGPSADHTGSNGAFFIIYYFILVVMGGNNLSPCDKIITFF